MKTFDTYIEFEKKASIAFCSGNSGDYANAVDEMRRLVETDPRGCPCGVCRKQIGNAAYTTTECFSAGIVIRHQNCADRVDAALVPNIIQQERDRAVYPWDNWD